MKNLNIAILCTLFFASANAQMISRSSIAAITAHTSNETSIIAHHISKVNLVTTQATTEASASTTNETSAISETAKTEVGSLTTYPNPAINNMHFVFEMPATGKVIVSVYNAMGQKVSDVYENNYNGGSNNQEIDLSSFSSGMYFLSLSYTGADQQTHTITNKFQIIK